MNKSEYCVYIMTNQRNTVLYTGVTNNIGRRLEQHRQKTDKRSFTSRYNIEKLVYVEAFETPSEAIIREKQIKNMSRKKKEALIASFKPGWRDLTEEVVQH